MAKTDTPEAEAQAQEAKPRGAGRSRSTKATAPKNRRGMTQEHKDKLRVGREEGRIVSDYLVALDTHKPKRGRKITPDTIKQRIEQIDTDLIAASGTEKVRLIQNRMDLHEQLRVIEDNSEVASLQEAFVRVARSYSERNGISYAAFREAGVPPAVLKEAGLTRKSA